MGKLYNEYGILFLVRIDRLPELDPFSLKGDVAFMNLFDFLMFILTIFIAAGVVRSARMKNGFAVGFGIVALCIFLLADVLILTL